MENKVKELKEEILELKTYTDQYQEELELEIENIESQIDETKTKIKETQELTNSLRNDYQKGESKIVTLQFAIENAKNELKEHNKMRNQLETLNDHWEKSIRSLEFFNTELETQLSQTEGYVMSLHSKLQDTSEQTKETVKKFQAQCEELKLAITKPQRNASPLIKPPVSPRSQMQLSKLSAITILSKQSAETSYKVVLVSPDNLYINENAVVIKENSLKKIFEFGRVVKLSEFTNELIEPCSFSSIDQNVCIVLSSGKNRQDFIYSVIQKISALQAGRNLDFNCVEIIKDNVSNLFPYEWRAICMGQESKSIVLESLRRLSKGKNHLLFTFKYSGSVLQILDLGEINEDQSLSESLSINASLFYLEEMMMSLAKGKPNFDKSNLTKKLKLSLSDNCYVLFLMKFDDVSDLPAVSLAARLQSMFNKSQTENGEVKRSLAMLEKERLANFEVLRLIEKAQKDMLLLKKASREKDTIIADLQNKLKENDKPDRISSLSPTYLNTQRRPSRIPIPKPNRVLKNV